MIFLNRARGAFAFVLATSFLIGSLYFLPGVLEVYRGFDLPIPVQTQYGLYVFLTLSILMALLGIQIIFDNPKRETIEAKLKEYKSGQLVDMRKFNNKKFTYLFLGLFFVYIGYAIYSIVYPVYEVSLLVEMSADSSNKKRIVDTSSWQSQQIGKSSFYLKYPEKTTIEQTDRCIRITHGFAYLTISESGSDSLACVPPAQGMGDQITPVSYELIIDGTEYDFSGNFVNTKNNPNSKGVNYEYFRNEQGIFGNGYKVEYGGHFKPVEVGDYTKDKEAIINILESAYRDSK